MTTERTGSGGRIGRRAAAVVVILSAIVLWLGIARLGAPDEGSPARSDYDVGAGIPVTMHHPGEPDDGDVVPRGPDEAPPVVVLGHGFSGDRRIMTRFADALARSGYAAVTLDFRGHGANPAPFRGDVADDLFTVVDSLQNNPWVDGERIALLGHSMGASAAMQAGAHDERVSAIIAVSGTRFTGGEREPPSVLLIVAARDPQGIRNGVEEAASRLRGERVVDVEGTDHLSVIFADETIRETVRWLDRAFDVDRDDAIPSPPGRYAGVVLPLLAALVLIAAIGVAAGRRAKVTVTGGSPFLALLTLAGALVVALPVVRMATVASFLPLAVADTLFSYLVIVTALFALGMRRRLAPIGEQLRASFLPALFAFGAIFLVLAPLLGNFHRVTPTPKRFLAMLIGAAICIPFFLVVENVVRRGGTGTATLWSVVARVVVLVAILGGATRGYLPGVVGLVVPILVATFVLFEVFATAAYSAGRNTSLIGVTEGLWLAWLVSIALPITI